MGVAAIRHDAVTLSILMTEAVIYCGWAVLAIRERLMSGLTVLCHPRGNSMEPLISDGDLVTIGQPTQLKVGDIVFCRVKGRYVLHKITAINNNRYQISNNNNFVNGWVGSYAIFGKVKNVRHG